MENQPITNNQNDDHNNKNMPCLNLSNRNYIDENVVEIAKNLSTDKFYKIFDISKNTIKNSGTIMIAKMLHSNTCVQRLILSVNGICNEGAIALAEALKKNKTVKYLDLSSNNIGYDGITSISDMLLINSTLTSLYLADNIIERNGVAEISKSLIENNSLTLLDLSYNNIGDAGAKSIANMLKHNTCLSKLFLIQNKICVQGTAKIFKSLRNNKTLLSLIYSWNNVDASHVEIANMIKNNICLTTLDISNCNINYDGILNIAKSTISNSSLKKLELCGNITRYYQDQSEYIDLNLYNEILLERTLYRCSNYGKYIRINRSDFLDEYKTYEVISRALDREELPYIPSSFSSLHFDVRKFLVEGRTIKYIYIHLKHCEIVDKIIKLLELNYSLQKIGLEVNDIQDLLLNEIIVRNVRTMEEIRFETTKGVAQDNPH